MVGWAPPTALILAILSLFLVAGCGSVPKREAAGPSIERQPSATTASAPPSAPTRRGGGYYLDDGPGDNPPANLDAIPDAVPRPEPIRKANVRPYEALGKTYAPMAELAPYKERGIASWYGRRYHGQKTASGEIYDMYGMSAAHPTLPIPSYARVTNLKSNKSVVVRINDRGPFHSDRLIDLSYTAAYKLSVLAGGSQWVEVESILPGSEPATMVAAIPQSYVRRETVTPPSAPTQQEPQPPQAEKQPAAEEKPDVMQALAATNEPAGVYLQLGAFSARDNAENFLARMRSQLAALTESISIFAKDGLFRVHVGPYASQLLARQAAERISQALDIKPVVLTR